MEFLILFSFEAKLVLKFYVLFFLVGNIKRVG